MFMFDTWQYFLHRYMHLNKFLYKHLISWHHPVEWLLMDTIGGALAFLKSGMSPRASIVFFSFAVVKGIDDHCRLWLPWNPFQAFFAVNSAYHDIHQQLYGNKHNFSQPFFVVWDRIMGTHLPYLLEKRIEVSFMARPVKD
ncbi:Sphinganine C(4)-monooxygenase 2 [Acorus calamus]|uniref:aldehyde oxygenase (deformylating) n=1 Tax=Acorus calamus TaxID=4465 RepID=A0AAV9EN77_ACOCL|nr:Sphinganine C(4)-monooxygenase 2 [Acorus calamus]